MQTTLLGLAIAFILALIAALIGPYFVDWNQFRPQFEAEASRVVGIPVRVNGALEARLLPAPSLRLRSVVVGGNDSGKARADKLDVEFSLGALMRGEWRATELTINGAAFDVGLDAQGRIDVPTPSGRFNFGSLAIDRLNLTGRVTLHDAASGGMLELSDIAFGGDVRSLAGSLRGDGNFTLAGSRYPFRVSSGETASKNGTRVHLTIDPGDRPLSLDLDGVLSFDARAPRFDGGIVVASPPGKSKAREEKPAVPWRVSAKLKADPAAARLEQLETSYGADETALKLAGGADIRFGASPLFHAVLAARQIDADRLLAQDDPAKQPLVLLSAFRNGVAAFPRLPIATQIEVSAEQIMLGGRPLLNVGADLHSDMTAWTIDRLNFRAPGTTRLALTGAAAHAGSAGGFSGTLDIESADPDSFAAWLQGRSEPAYRAQKPLHVTGDITATSERLAVEALKAESDGSIVAGRVAFSDRSGGNGSRLDADLKADGFDLDAALALLRSIAGPQENWPDEARLSIDAARATSAGQEMKPFVAQLGYGPNTISLERLRIGQGNGVVLEGSGAFDRTEVTGKLALNATSDSLARIAGLVSPFAPAFAARLNAIPPVAGRTSVQFALDVGRDRVQADRAAARAVLNLAAPQINGALTMTATPSIAAVRGMDIRTLSRGEVTLESKLSAASGSAVLALLGLERTVAAGQGALSFEGSATGAWRAPLRVTAKFSGADFDADVQGTADLAHEKPQAALAVVVRRANVAPLFGLKPSDPVAQNISLSSHLAVADGKLTFDDIDALVAGSRIRGHAVLNVTAGTSIDAHIGMDTVDLAPALGFALGTRGPDAGEPLGRGFLQGWRGQVTFEALRGALPGGGELRPVSGVIKSDGQSFSVDAFKGGIGGGEAMADIDVKPTSTGYALGARVGLKDVDGAALRFRSLSMPAGRSSLRMTLAGEGRSAGALAGALSGGGLVTIDAARIAGLNPAVFDAAIRASDSGQATDDSRLRQIVEPLLSAGTLPVASVQIPFSIKDGRLRIGATTLDGEGARAVVSGGYDISADQTDLRVSLISTALATAVTRPEISLFAAGSPDRLDRTVDVAALSSWLAVRSIDRETRRLDLLERNEAPAALPASIPPSMPAPVGKLPEAPVAPPADVKPPAEAGLPSAGPRRLPVRPRFLPGPQNPAVTQQLAPLPPPIDVRPAPGARPSRPRPAPPLVLTPPAASQLRPAP